VRAGTNVTWVNHDDIPPQHRLPGAAGALARVGYRRQLLLQVRSGGDL
jgi:hypothetical protein